MSQPVQPDPGQVAFLQSAEATIEAKFPIIKTIYFSDRAEQTPIQAPFFVGLIAAILQSANKPCCVVLPDSRGVTLAVSTLVALSRLRLDVPDILRSYASMSFQPRDRVLVHPSDLVYEYLGFFCPEFFKLKVVDRNESRSLSVHEVARLEKTIREATYAASSLAPVASPVRTLAMAKAQAEAKNSALDAERQDVRVDVSVPVYAEAASVVQRMAPQHGEISSCEWIMRRGQPAEIPEPTDEPVFTSRVEAEEWQKLKQRKGA